MFEHSAVSSRYSSRLETLSPSSRVDRKTYDRIAREVEAGTLDWSSLVKA